MHLGKIGYRLTHHSPTLRRKRNSFYGYPLFISPLPAPWLYHIKRIPFKTDNPPCFVPAVLAGLSWFEERWKNGFQKTGKFFGMFGSRNIRKQIIFSLTTPSRHLGKDRCGDNPPPEETDRINLSFTCISSAAILFF